MGAYREVHAAEDQRVDVSQTAGDCVQVRAVPPRQDFQSSRLVAAIMINGTVRELRELVAQTSQRMLFVHAVVSPKAEILGTAFLDDMEAQEVVEGTIRVCFDV